MGLQKMLVFGVVVFVVVVGAWYFLGRGDSMHGRTGSDIDSVQNSDAEMRDVDTESNDMSGTGSFLELFGRGKSFRCEFRSETEGNMSNGTAYVDGARERVAMQGEYQTDGEKGSFNVITDGDTTYWWSETPEGKMGMKMTVPEGTDEGTATEYDTPHSGVSSPVGVTDEVSYDCDPWRVDASVFVPPSDVEFTDMDAFLENMMQGFPEGFEMPAGVSQ